MAVDPVSEPADAMVTRLGDLAGALRAMGTRVGVGELLTAVRGLEAVDATSREDARLALKTILCSQKADLERFDLAFVAVFGDGVVSGRASRRIRSASWGRSSGPSCRGRG